MGVAALKVLGWIGVAKNTAAKNNTATDNTDTPARDLLPARDLMVVLFGGASPEHEVSCRSGFSIAANADPDRFDVELLGITKSGQWVRPDRDHRDHQAGADRQATADNSLCAEGAPVNASDELESIRQRNGVIFPALHGPGGEDGTVQGMFELAGVAYVGAGVGTSAVCMDKVVTRQVLVAARLEVTPHKVVVRRADSSLVAAGSPGAEPPDAEPLTTKQLTEMAEQLGGFPLFVKPPNMGSSFGVSKVHGPGELDEAIELAARFDSHILLEQAIAGREIECALLGSWLGDLRSALPGEIVPADEFYTYEDKYLRDQAQLLVPAPMEAQDQDRFMDLAVRAGQAVGIEGLGRVDFLWDEARGPYISEINTIPGFTSISLYPLTWQASGLNLAGLVAELYDLGRQAHDRRVGMRRGWGL